MLNVVKSNIIVNLNYWIQSTTIPNTISFRGTQFFESEREVFVENYLRILFKIKIPLNKSCPWSPTSHPIQWMLIVFSVCKINNVPSIALQFKKWMKSLSVFVKVSKKWIGKNNVPWVLLSSAPRAGFIGIVFSIFS